jgi:alkylation response protein AidB-like acyl-CoA dehydrogenase
MSANQTAGLSPEMSDMVLETARDILAQDLPDERSLELDAAHRFPETLVRKLLSPEVGLQLLFLPEAVGGLGGGARDICRLSELMAGRDLGVATAFLAIMLGTDPILVGGTDEQKQRWLGRIAEEGLIVAYGVTEPGAGSDYSAFATTAAPLLDDDGNLEGYLIDGVKQFITNGSVADLYTIMAKTPEGPSFFVVERGTPGLSFGRPEDKHGICASDTCSVVLENLRVPAENLLGDLPGRGLVQANAVFGYTRLMVGALALGAGQAALHRAIDFATTRVQFGSPLLEKQGYVLKLLVPHWIDLAAGRSYLNEIALRIDEGEVGLQVEGSIGKLWASETGCRTCDAAIQALGGYGYTREYMVEKYARDVRITTIYEGTSEIQQSIIGMNRWKSAVKSKGAFYLNAAREMDELHGEDPDVGADLQAVAFRTLDAIIQRCHRTKAVRQQIVQFTLANLITRTEVGAALCREAVRKQQARAPQGDCHVAASRIFTRQTISELQAGGHHCLTGFLDEGDSEGLAVAAATLSTLTEGIEPSRLVGSWKDMTEIAEAIQGGQLRASPVSV